MVHITSLSKRKYILQQNREEQETTLHINITIYKYMSCQKLTMTKTNKYLYKEATQPSGIIH